MRNRSSQFNVTHPFAAYLEVGYFHTAAIADNAPVTDGLKLAAVALPLLGRTEDALAEEPVLFRP